MKKAILLFLLCPFFGAAQLTDTTCIDTRWIALKPTVTNATIFGLDSTLPEEQDLIHVIRDLVEAQEMEIYHQHQGFNNRRDFFAIDYQMELVEFMKDSLNDNRWRPYFTLYGPQSDIPLSDEYGEPLVRLSPEGFYEYVYPPRDVYYYPTKIVDEIRIKEKRAFNEKTKKFEFVPIGLTFYFKKGNHYGEQEAFWVDLREFSRVLKENTKYPWYKTIYEKEYRGFQYMQASCYE